MKGNLLFVKNYTWIGNRIRNTIHSEFNHIGIFVSDTEIVEATFLGVKLSSIKKFEELKKQNKLDYAIYSWNKDVPGELVDRLIDKVKKEVGAGYDFWQLLSQGIFWLFRVSRLVEPIELDHRWICSELIGEKAYEVGIFFNSDADPDNMTPVDILNSGLIKRIYDTY